jgi:hypothetical protein
VPVASEGYATTVKFFDSVPARVLSKPACEALILGGGRRAQRHVVTTPWATTLILPTAVEIRHDTRCAQPTATFQTQSTLT